MHSITLGVAETEVQDLPVARESRKQADGWEVRHCPRNVCDTDVMRFSLLGARNDNWRGMHGSVKSSLLG